jgi:hypothetical protein
MAVKYLKTRGNEIQRRREGGWGDDQTPGGINHEASMQSLWIVTRVQCGASIEDRDGPGVQSISQVFEIEDHHLLGNLTVVFLSQICHPASRDFLIGESSMKR